MPSTVMLDACSQGKGTCRLDDSDRPPGGCCHLRFPGRIEGDSGCTKGYSLHDFFNPLYQAKGGFGGSGAKGAATIEKLQPGDRILIAEACTHHALQDDIGRVKIPRWLRQYIGGEIQADVCSGRDYPGNLQDYKLVIHCGACMLTRREMLNRIQTAKEAGVPVTNFGVAISVLQGVVKRTLTPFPAALMAYNQARGAQLRG